MEYDKVELEKLSVYQLREIARTVGVKSPTTLTKKQLINNIIGVFNGEILPCFSKRGRPFKKYQSTEQDKKVEKLNDKLQEIEKLIEEFKKKLLSILIEE